MNAELAITILLAFTTAVSAFVLFLAVKVINDMNYLCEKLDRRIEFIKRLEKEHRELSKVDDSKTALQDAIRNHIAEAINRQRSLNVVDKDKPLDFPNDHKE